MGGVVFIIILVIYGINALSDGSKGVSIRDSQRGYAGLIWVLVFVFNFAVIVAYEEAGIIAFVLCLPFIFPSAFSLFTAKNGWVKTSFYFGRICFGNYSRNPYSGALFRAFQASQKLSSSQQLEALTWLQSRYSCYKGKLFSGDMLMIVMIEAMLKRPGDTDFVRQELKLLSSVGKDSIPGGISEFFCKFTLAPALSSGRWAEVLVVANQWNTPSSNRVAQYVIEYYGYHVQAASYHYRWIDVFMASLFAPNQKKLGRALQGLTEGGGEVETQHVIPRQWARRINNEPYEREVLTKEVQYMLTNDTKTHWEGRVQTLGLWQPDEALESIVESLNHFVNLSCADGQAEDVSEDQLEQYEREYKNIYYICRNIDKQVEKKGHDTSINNFFVWLNIWRSMQVLKTSTGGWGGAFSMMHDSLWNWIALLWNTQRDLSVTYFISSASAPIAKEGGHEKFYQSLRSINMGEVK